MSIKEVVKKAFPNIYFHFHFKALERRFSSIQNITNYVQKTYLDRFGVPLDVDNPKAFYEKICYLKLFYIENNPEQLVDKVLVKGFLSSLGFEKKTTKKIASFYSFKEFKHFFKQNRNDIKTLVVKLNHTSGDVFFYINGKWKDKKGHQISKRFVFACLKHTLRINYYHVGLEKVYANIIPQILVEEYVPSLGGLGLDEYKFFVNKGEIKLINVVYGRQNGDKLEEAFTDVSLHLFPIKQDKTIIKQENIKRPKCFDEMIDFCKKTVSDRLFIRVDLMTNGETFDFCEFTFYDCAGMNIFYPLEYNKILGDLIDITPAIKEHTARTNNEKA